MAQVSGNKLIDVRFIDETNYTAATDDADIVSVIVDTCWGPCERPTVCDSATYRSLFNPQGLGWLNRTRATVERVFDMGAAYVEVMRLGKHEKWRFMGGASVGADMSVAEVGYTDLSSVDAFASVDAIGSWNYAFRLRYAGGFPMRVSLASAAKGTFGGEALFDLKVEAYAGSATVTSGGASTTEPKWLPLETLQVTFKPLEVAGQSYFYADVISQRSTYLYADTVWAHAQAAKVSTVNPLAAPVVWYPYDGASTYSVTIPRTLKIMQNGKEADKSAPETFFFDSKPSGTYASLIPSYHDGSAIAYASGEGTKAVSATLVAPTINGQRTGGYQASDYAQMYDFAKSRDTSVATLYVNSFERFGDTFVEADLVTVQQAMVSHTEGRMDCNSLVGFPTRIISGASTQQNNGWASGSDAVSEQATVSSAVTYFNKIGGGGMTRFTDAIVGWEVYTLTTLYGTGRFDMDCTAAWAGRICAVAKSLRNRNQLPSYKAYGQFSGALARSLSFNSVVSLHDDYGIGSVYYTTTGNYIFNIRSLWGASESYFARMNVMRVCAALLGNTFDVVEGVIHTDAAANRNNRLRLESRLNSLIGEMASRGELKNQSYADVGDEINQDVDTHGGRYLNIRLVLWFIGLVERINITVIATDSSVRAEISQSVA